MMAMTIPDNIDIDEEKIQLNGEWLTVDDLKKAIQQKVQAGDFDVADLSMALKTLDPVVKSLKPITVKVTKDVSEAFDKLASASGERKEHWIRQALAVYMNTEEARKFL